MEPLRKILLDRFEEHVCNGFSDYCNRYGLNPNDTSSFLGFMIDQDLIATTRMQRYALLKEFETMDPNLTRHKTRTVHLLAHKFRISERTVWSALREEEKKNV